MNSEAARLRDEGYVDWPQAVPQPAVDRALHAIHRHLGTFGLPPDRIPEFENATYCPELRSDPAIMGLFSGPLRSHAERLLGPLEPVQRAQIALRFPVHDDRAPRILTPHLDGVAAPHNGVAEGAIMTFSALAGVYLEPVVADGGAFTVWPGSHRAYAAYFEQHGPRSLLDGLPRVHGAPRPIVGGSGHGFIAHYLLGHAVGGHRGPRIRYAVFFRLRARGHEGRGLRTMVEPWLEWRLNETIS